MPWREGLIARNYTRVEQPMSKQTAEIRSGSIGQSPVRLVAAGDIQPRAVRDWREVMALWAAHERGDIDSEHEPSPLPRGLSNYRPDLRGLSDRAQAHGYVAAVVADGWYPSYGFAYPVLWWSVTMSGPFRAAHFLRVRHRISAASEQAALGELGFTGRDPARVLDLFLGRLELLLEAEPLLIYPMMEAPCGIEIAEQIAREVSARVERSGDGIRSF